MCGGGVMRIPPYPGEDPWGDDAPIGNPSEVSNLPEPSVEEGASSEVVRLTTARDITPVPVEWLLEPSIALGTLTLLAGREGLGKSTYAAHLVAQATRGHLAGALTSEPTDVVWVTNEDALAYTLVPRLIAAGADLDRIHFADVSDGITRRGLVLPLDTERLREAIEGQGARLMVLDPLVSVLDGKLDSHKDHSIRQALDPINRLAETAGTAVIGVVHLNKGGGSDLLDRVLGSRAFTAAARSVLGLVADPDDEEGPHRLVIHWKSNLGPRAPEATVVEVVDSTVRTPAGEAHVGRIVEHGTRAVRLIDVLGPSEDLDDLSEVGKWLLTYLAGCGGEAPRNDLMAAAKSAGYSPDQVKRVRQRTGVQVSRTSEFPSVTYWHHPDNSPQSGQSARLEQSGQTPGTSAPSAFRQTEQSSLVSAPTALTAPTAPTDHVLRHDATERKEHPCTTPHLLQTAL